MSKSDELLRELLEETVKVRALLQTMLVLQSELLATLKDPEKDGITDVETATEFIQHYRFKYLSFLEQEIDETT
ncbi:MAG: hypothetical protein ACR2LT_09115 [Pyrinomonadaceae bacterium]